MANTWQLAHFPLVNGINGKHDDLALEPPGLLMVENAVFTRLGQLKKRFGYRQLGTGTARELFTRGDELVRLTETSLETYSEKLDAFVDKGEMPSIANTIRVTDKVEGEQALGDQCTYGGLTVTAWEDSRGSARFSVKDAETGATLYADQEIADGALPRVIRCGLFIHLYYYHDSSRTLRCKRIVPANLAASMAATDVETVDDMRFTTTPCYVVSPFSSSRVLLMYTDDSTLNFFVLGLVKQTGALEGAPTAYVKDSPADPETTALDARLMETGNILAVFSNADVTAGFEVNDDLSSTGIVSSFDDPDAIRITIAVPSPVAVVDDGGITSTLTGTRGAYIFAEQAGATETNSVVTAYQWIAMQGTASPSTSIRHSTLASRGFGIGEEGYAVIQFISPLQNTYFLLRGRGFDVQSSQGKPFVCNYILPDTAAGTPANLDAYTPATSAHLPTAYVDGSDATVCLGYRTRLPSIATTSTGSGLPDDVNPVYAERGLRVVTMAFGGRVQAVQKGQGLYLTGGQGWLYDGLRPVESSFLVFVEAVTTADGAAGVLTAGARSYRVYPKWTNAAGEVEVGNCSSVFIATNAGSKKTILTIPTIAHTLRCGDRANLSFDVYRTELNPNQQSPFQLVSSLDPTTVGDDNGYVVNDITADTVTFTDNMADADLTSKAIDPRNSGLLDNVAPFPGTSVWSAQGRVWMVGFEDPNLCLFSKLVYAGEMPTWNDALQVITDEDGGPLVAGASMNETVVLFKRGKIYRVDGIGPNNLGQGEYSPPTVVATDVGCVDPGSIVTTASGIQFKSAKGTMLLNQGWGVDYVGAPVEPYNAQSVTAATLIPDRNQVVYLTDTDSVTEDGRPTNTLIYDHFYAQWGTYTNHRGVCATLWQNQYVYCNGTRIGIETPDEYRDFGSWITLALETAWFKFGGIQGFQAIRSIGLLGRYVSPHSLRVSYQYNNEVGFKFSRVWDPSSVVSTGVYGGDGTGTYGSVGPYGGAGSRNYQCFHGLAMQKCQSVRFRIEDVAVSGEVPGASFVLSNIGLELAVLGGFGRHNQLRNIGGPKTAPYVPTGG